jgi:type I restriction enzyme M protein
VLRDDGITYHQYVTELTYILFLKIAKETGVEEVTGKTGDVRVNIPEGYRWDDLVRKSGIELKRFYKDLLNHLGENCTGRVREIYQGQVPILMNQKILKK